jgi:hypothetical protein
MKIRKSIEKALAKRPGYVATIRRDTVLKAIERGEYHRIRCAYHYTDDYAWDAANNNGQRDIVSKDTMLREFSILNPSCWVDPKPKELKGNLYYEVSIMFHSNLAYDMYVPFEEVPQC